MKKIFLFIIGFFLVPAILGFATAYLFNMENYETYVGFWESVYLLIYVIFPFIFRGKIKQSVNKYIVYTIIYALMFLILCLLKIHLN